jgi:hypothetical protein
MTAKLRSHLDPLVVARLDPGGHAGEAPHWNRPQQVDLEPPRDGVEALAVHEQRHRLVESGGDHAAVRETGRTLVVLLDEEAALRAAVGQLDLELEPEQVREPAAEAEIVVGERQLPLEQLPQHEVEDPAVAVVEPLVRGVDPHGGVELDVVGGHVKRARAVLERC